MNVNDLRNALEVFAEIDPEIQLQTMLVLLHVASVGSCSQKSLETALGLSPASASRNASYWTDRRFDRKPGAGFIRKDDDPHDQRTKNLTLTSKGTHFIEQLRGSSNGKTSRK